MALTACKKDPTEGLTLPSHQVVYTSEMDFQNTIQVGGEITLGDISQGVLSRKWTFPSSGVDIVNSDNDLESTEATVKAIFTEVGDQEILLTQTFENDAFVGEEIRGRELDTTIIIRVLDSIEASVEAFYLNEDGSLGAPLVMENGALNPVEASKSVRFMYSTIGEPDFFTWTFEGGDPGVVEQAGLETDVKYKRMGVYDVSFRTFRNRPFGQDTVNLKDFIEVVPSTDPVDLERVTEMEGDVALVFSREMDPTTLSVSDFNVTIQNGEDFITPSLSGATVDAQEGSIVRLALNGESLFNDDTILVSYTPGALRTLDGITADAFADQQLEFNKVNILAENSSFDFSFENSVDANWPYLGWGEPWDAYSLNVSFDQAHTGDFSAFIEMQPGGGMIVGHKDLNNENVTFPVLESKTYEMGVWVYVEDPGDLVGIGGGLLPDLRLYWNPNTDWAIKATPTIDLDMAVGEWVYSSAFVNFTHSGPTSIMIRGFNQTNSQPLQIYIDDITLAEVQLRP